MLDGRNRLQSDLDRLQGWADENRMGFNTDKCKVMHLGRKNQQQTYRLGNSLLIIAEAEKDLGVITDAKMNMGQQCGDQSGRPTAPCHTPTDASQGYPWR